MELSNLKKWIRPALNALPSKRKMIIGILVIIAIMLIAIPLSNRWMYPLKYEEEIRNSAKQYGVSPYLVMGVIRVETKFSPEAVSHKTAQGLMQLTPQTVDEVIGSGNFSNSTRDQIAIPAMNIQMGTWYLSHLLERFQGNEPVAVAAYNAGPNRVDGWLKNKVWDGTLQNADDIPYPETRKYVQKVMAYYSKYKSIYGE